MLLNLPSLSASSDLNCCDRLLSFFASDLLMLLSPFLSSCEKPMLELPLDEAPVLPVEPALPLLPAPMLSDDPLDAPPLAPAPVLLLSDGEDVLLDDGDEEEDGEEEELDPLAPVLLEPLALGSALELLLLGPDWAKAPNEASEADIANVRISFLFIEDLLHSCTQRGTAIVGR